MNVAVGWPCPQCGETIAFLGSMLKDDRTNDVVVFYLTCKACEHTWLQAKWNPN